MTQTQPVIRWRGKDWLARALGCYSIGMGIIQVAAPRAMCRLVGARDDGASPWVMAAVGTREISQGLGILTRPRPVGWLWSRVVGDALDLSLLGLVAARNRRERRRTALAIASVLAVTAPDVFESLRLTREAGRPPAARLVRKSVTIRRPRPEVEEAWRSAQGLRRRVEESGATVKFADAPGNRGTELVVEFVYSPPAGDLGAAVEKLTGKDLATQLGDDLRRLKQQIETGDIVRSDSTPDGHLLPAQLKQRPAQPLAEAVR